VGRTVALIPARGGSKRLPRKNIIDFHGKPMIAYTIEAALSTACFDEVIVSTEDHEIAAITKQYDVTIHRRLPALATDSVSVTDVCLSYLNECDVTTLAVLYATAPMRNVDDIHAVMSLLSTDCHFAMAATLCEWPVHQVMTLNQGRISPLFPDLVNKNSDEVGEYCIDNGSTYAVNVKSFLKQKTFYGDSLKVYLMPTSRSIDIDTPDDYYHALYEAERLNI